MNDCERRDGLHLSIDFALIHNPTFHIPNEFTSPSQSKFLCETLARINIVWVMNNEKACRMVLDAILTELLVQGYKSIEIL
jgi:hypothetical protein